MRKIITSLGIFILFSIASVAYCQKPALQLTIMSDKEVYELGEKIIISGYFKNNSSEKIYAIKDDKPLLWCRLIVENPQGIEFWYDAYPTEEFGPASLNAYTTILPNQSIEYFTFKAIAGKLLGNEFNWFYKTTVTPPKVNFPFVQKGLYKIKFLYINLTPTRKDALKGKFSSNTITLKVTEKTLQSVFKKVDEKILQFHLTNLGRKLSQVEKQVIERALVLMEANDVRTDYPLRSIKHNDRMGEWVLEFNDMRPDAAFWLFLKDQDATYFEVKYTLIRNRIRYDYISPPQLPPWADKAPYSYQNEDKLLVAESYKETWVESSAEKHPEAVQKAKEVLREWGQNPDKYEYEGKIYDYKISVSESPNFISVVFLPIGLEGLEQHVEVRMTKKDFVVLSILPGV